MFAFVLAKQPQVMGGDEYLTEDEMSEEEYELEVLSNDLEQDPLKPKKKMK